MPLFAMLYKRRYFFKEPIVFKTIYKHTLEDALNQSFGELLEQAVLAEQVIGLAVVF